MNQNNNLLKLVFVLSVEDLQKEVGQLFQQAGIAIYSSMNIEGIKTNQTNSDANNWFAAGTTTIYSTANFSFTSEESAQTLIDLVREYNSNHSENFPLHAYQLAVEKAA